MIKTRLNFIPMIFSAVLFLSADIAFGEITTFTETFDTDASSWLDGNSGTPDHLISGGVGDSGYISFTAPDFNSGVGGFGDPLTLMFRGNGGDASGGAFVGDWLADQVETFSVAVRHNYTTSLNLYSRIDRGLGQAASLANSSMYEVAPNTWTDITFPITDSNPPFLSYGAGTFTGVFSGVQNIQLGFYLPANTDFSGFRMDLDNVSVATAIPEPSSLGIIGISLVASLIGRRRRG